jgi:hypothetical protein
VKSSGSTSHALHVLLARAAAGLRVFAAGVAVRFVLSFAVLGFADATQASVANAALARAAVEIAVEAADVLAIYPVNKNLTDQESESEASVHRERPEPNRTKCGTPQRTADCHGYHDARRNKQ